MRELKGFELVELNKGETRTINFTLTNKELGYYSDEGEYSVEPGDFEVYVGGSSNATMMKPFTLGQE